MKSLSFDPESFSLDQTLLVGPQWVGRRLDQVVGEQPGVTSRQMARRLILESSVLVNGHGAKPSSKVKDQDQIQIHIPPARPARLEGEPVPLDILYEDPWLVVLNKPAGVAVHPSAGHARGTLVHFLLAHCGAMSNVGGEQRPGIVHRLDKDTSGVLVAAKNNGTHNHLASQFKLHSIHRSYLALVTGNPVESSGTIRQPLDRDPHNRLKRAISPQGKRAVTHWKVEKRLGPFTLLRVTLETGRTHQIRAHMAWRDWPVVGDPVYGKSRHRGLALAPEVMAALDRFHRQALHAQTLGFIHPQTGQFLSFSAPLPPDMAGLLQILEPLGMV